jgi:hypothetical protein
MKFNAIRARVHGGGPEAQDILFIYNTHRLICNDCSGWWDITAWKGVGRDAFHLLSTFAIGKACSRLALTKSLISWPYTNQEHARHRHTHPHSSCFQAYLQHLIDQWSDRQIYWHARSLSQRIAQNAVVSSLTQSMLCVMADGMDQGKFRIPRTRGIKVKGMDSFPRPALHVAGVLAHGYALHLAVSLPDVGKDANTNIETMSLMFDSILEHRGKFPQHLWLQQDNAPNQCKNQKMFRWCIYLVMAGAAIDHMQQRERERESETETAREGELVIDYKTEGRASKICEIRSPCHGLRQSRPGESVNLEACECLAHIIV